MPRHRFRIEVDVEADDIEEARLIAIEKMLNALNKPETIKLVEAGESERE